MPDFHPNLPPQYHLAMKPLFAGSNRHHRPYVGAPRPSAASRTSHLTGRMLPLCVPMEGASPTLAGPVVTTHVENVPFPMDGGYQMEPPSAELRSPMEIWALIETPYSPASALAAGPCSFV
jgi:hypothetical protein